MRFSLTLPDKLGDKVMRFAEDHSISISDAIKFLISEGLEKQGIKVKREKEGEE